MEEASLQLQQAQDDILSKDREIQRLSARLAWHRGPRPEGLAIATFLFTGAGWPLALALYKASYGWDLGSLPLLLVSAFYALFASSLLRRR